MSVLAESNLAAFRSVLQNSEGPGGYRAANGSSVEMSGTAEIGVQMHMSGPSGDDRCWKKARLNVLVGSIKHNILSIMSLADSGWRFAQGPKGFDLFHEKLGMHCLDVATFANCPWVRWHPDACSSSAYHSDLTMSSTQNLSVSAVTGGEDDEMARHRRQGTYSVQSELSGMCQRTFGVPAQTRQRRQQRGVDSGRFCISEHEG